MMKYYPSYDHHKLSSQYTVVKVNDEDWELYKNREIDMRDMMIKSLENGLFLVLAKHIDEPMYLLELIVSNYDEYFPGSGVYYEEVFTF